MRVTIINYPIYFLKKDKEMKKDNLKNKSISQYYDECNVKIENHKLIVKALLSSEEANIDTNEDCAIIFLKDKEEVMTIKKITFIVLNLVNKIDTMQEQNMKFQKEMIEFKEKIDQKIYDVKTELKYDINQINKRLDVHEKALKKAKLL